MKMTNTEHQREIDSFDRRQIELEQQDHEREVEEANNDYLFNIPSDIWFDNWKQVHDPEYCLQACSFWRGVAACGSYLDMDDFDDRHILAMVAMTVAEDLLKWT